ncbi:MAG: RDD family protein [Ignavibacteriae bacterium]|nr:RDD family protein [Ignavibacteria bacterium]MBI3365063.1 RDD family protein [Ignavibacteriota bacterium]
METTTTPPIATAIPQPRPVSYAGFWKRFFAWIIDHILLGVVELFIFIPFIGMMGLGTLGWHRDDFEEPSLEFLVALVSAYIAAVGLALLASWLYYALMESKKGATLGKMALGIMVTDMHGNPISFGRASGRYFAKIVSNITLGIGFIIAGFTQQKQALHDILAGCLVVNK